jgi:hypothetical protein
MEVDVKQPLVVGCALALSLLAPRPALSQEAAAPAPVTQQSFSSAQLKELNEWMKKDAEYLKWYKTYGNKAKRVKMRHRPEPPAWLDAECAALIGGEGVLVNACALLREIQEGDALTKARQAIEDQRAQGEQLNKTKWYEKIHLGGGWPIVSDLNQVKYGAIIETHISIVDVGRFEINLPGLMFLSLPGSHGRRIIKRATHYGVSLKLNTFTFPGTDKKFLAHLNFSTAKVDGFTGVGNRDRLALMGLSLTVKK